jgi:hypothetical protein
MILWQGRPSPSQQDKEDVVIHNRLRRDDATSSTPRPGKPDISAGYMNEDAAVQDGKRQGTRLRLVAPLISPLWMESEKEAVFEMDSWIKVGQNASAISRSVHFAIAMICTEAL